MNTIESDSKDERHEGELVVERDGFVTLVTINRPQAHNALNAGVIDALRQVVSACAADDGCRVVVITGSGRKAFCAGADLGEIAELTPDAAEAYMRAGQAAFRQIERADIPVICAVNGLALGGGFELILSSTFAILSSEASMGLPEASLGLIPGYGGTQRLPRLIGRQAATQLMLTGGRLSADRAHQLGLSPLPPVAPDDLLPSALEVARSIARQGPRAVRSILRAVREGQDAALDAALALESGLAALAIADDESREGVDAFLSRRPPQFRADVP
ncbi:enoyl-CoA hydratase/isomerase family protein [Nocardioides carbamazepini]|uniref:enoyl-CoA hydratase/isomerase family protein n=1 Tax=Nocardioides carbamazepini TaxID=2854259 RepID=UPI002149EB04|nr:enoyl-CoA hydratase/isomerase family protein [Nocardioides carbamazepini]MCR1781295.1 enoyl-CoA hydratase/isomerase family protein [Nocardioides carbamazepini]